MNTELETDFSPTLISLNHHGHHGLMVPPLLKPVTAALHEKQTLQESLWYTTLQHWAVDSHSNSQYVWILQNKPEVTWESESFHLFKTVQTENPKAVTDCGQSSTHRSGKE